MDLDTIITELSKDDSIESYWYYTDLKERVLHIFGEINPSILETVILPLQKFSACNEPITLKLHTTGGSVWDAAVLLDLIEKIKCPLTIEVLGYALSMGIYILMAGKNNPNVKRIAHSFSIGLIHPGSLALDGDARKVKQIQKFNDKIENKLKNFLLQNTNMTPEEYELHEDEEYYLTAEDMLRLGIVDEIV